TNACARISQGGTSVPRSGHYELLMRELRTSEQRVRTAPATDEQVPQSTSETKGQKTPTPCVPDASTVTDLQVVQDRGTEATAEPALSPFQARAWQWALERQQETGGLPSGKEIAAHFGRKERWGRLVKQHGQRRGAHVDLSGMRPRSSGTGGVPVNA